MSSQIQKKQAYLYKQIIEENYQPEKFQSFLISSKQDGDDLENWSMSQLKKIVEKFKKQQELLQFNEEQAREKEIQKKEDIINSIEKIQQKKSIDSPLTKTYSQQKSDDENSPKKLRKFQSFEQDTRSYESDKQSRITASDLFTKNNKSDYFNIVQCQKLIPNQFSINKINSRIIKCDKIQGGVFQKSYIAYTIETNSIHKVNRRFNDFMWLKQTLQMLHTGSIVPPIAKKSKFKKYEDKHLTKRMYILQMFLDKLLSIEQFRIDPLTEAFLTMAQKKQFDKLKSQFKKLTHVEPSKIRNHTGQVTEKLDKDSVMFNTEAKNYFTKLMPDVKKIYKDFKGTATSLEAAAQILKGVSTNCKRIAEKDSIFRHYCKIEPIQNSLFTLLEQISSKYSQILQDQAKIFRKQLYIIVKYETFYINNLLEHFQQYQNIKQQFANMNNSLLKKKEKLFNDGNMSKWDMKSTPSIKPSSKEDSFLIMLPKQTDKLNKVRDTFAVYNESLNVQIKQFMKEENSYLAPYIENFISREKDLNVKELQIWMKGFKTCQQLALQS